MNVVTADRPRRARVSCMSWGRNDGTGTEESQDAGRMGNMRESRLSGSLLLPLAGVIGSSG